MEARIITLEPEVEIQGVSFEEAFGEHSEARGRGRARRAERQVARQTRRMTRVESRGVRKAAKQEFRQGRKDTRKSRKVARKAMGDEPELESATNMQDPSMEQTSAPSYSQPRREPAYQEPSYQEEEPSYDEQSTVENESYGEAEEPLGDNSEYSDDESSFDAETTGETSSFDAETSDASGDKIESRLKVMQGKLQAHENAAMNLKKSLQSGKLPSNAVAKGARELKARVEHLNKMKVAYGQIVKKARHERSLTPVKSELNPSISTNKIVIPAKSADGEESSMLDGTETSSFDGKSFLCKNKGIIIGLGAAAIIIFALNKAKVFK